MRWHGWPARRRAPGGDHSRGRQDTSGHVPTLEDGWPWVEARRATQALHGGGGPAARRGRHEPSERHQLQDDDDAQRALVRVGGIAVAFAPATAG